MSEGASVQARTSQGTITVIAGKGYRRTYRWEDCEKGVTLWARASRWYGSLGLYYPGPSITWIPCRGISRAVVEEGQQHFEDEGKVMEWIRLLPFTHVYRNDGLLVDWGIVGQRSQLNVDVWQICINGEKPKTLPGGQDEAIAVGYPPGRTELAACRRIPPDELRDIQKKREEWAAELESLRKQGLIPPSDPNSQSR